MKVASSSNFANSNNNGNANNNGASNANNYVRPRLWRGRLQEPAPTAQKDWLSVPTRVNNTTAPGYD